MRRLSWSVRMVMGLGDEKIGLPAYRKRVEPLPDNRCQVLHEANMVLERIDALLGGRRPCPSSSGR